VDDLFTAGLERIYVLDQRVTGSYEFEVQPIREFFCARHLYETAAPTGDGADGQHGTRAERFDAMARNRYWTNVVRFYAGSYLSGEIGGLYFQLVEFKEDPDFTQSLQPRELATTLLGDWVFNDNPRVTKSLIESTFDDLGMRGASHSFSSRRAGPPIALPEGCGREELAERIFSALQHRNVPAVTRSELTRLLAANGGERYKQQTLELLLASQGEERPDWVRLGCAIQAFDVSSPEDLADFVLGDHPPLDHARARAGALLSVVPGTVEDAPPLVQLLIEAALAAAPVRAGNHLGRWLPQFVRGLDLADALNRSRSQAFRLPGQDTVWPTATAAITSREPSPTVAGALANCRGISSRTARQSAERSRCRRCAHR